MSTKPAASRNVTCSPYRRTENSTPNTDSRLKNSDACAGGTYFSATFCPSKPTHEANTTR